MKGIIIILFIFSIDAYTYGAPFDESEWVSGKWRIGKLERERNSKERNPSVWMRNSEQKRNESNVEYLQWLVKNWKDNGEKDRNMNREKLFIPLNLPRLKNKSDSSDTSSDSEETKLRILSSKKKWNFVGQKSNEKDKNNKKEEEEEEESMEKMSDELSIRKKRFSDEKDSRERNSDKNDHRENNFFESWKSTDETDSSSSERSNEYFDSREKKRKRDSEEYDSRKSSSSSSSSWEFDSNEEKFNDYLKDLLKKNQYYKEITEMLKNYKTDVYYERLYKWNKVKYLEWRKNIKLKNKILDEKKNLSMEILRRICNVSTNIKRKEQENRLKNCVGFYISTKDEFNFTADLSVYFEDTNIKIDGEESPSDKGSNNGYIRTTEGMKNSSTNEEKSFDNGNRDETIDGEQKEKEEQEEETKSSSRKDEIDNDEKPTDRNFDNVTQVTWFSQIGTEERTQTSKNENFENNTNRWEDSNVIWSTTPRKYLEIESSEASENRSTIFEASNVRDNDRNNDLDKNTVPSNNENENIQQSDNTESNGSEDLNISEFTMISANQETISRSTSRIEASTIWAKDGLSTISSIKFETIDNNDNFTTSSDINFTIATTNDINNNESFNDNNNVQPNPSSDKSNELKNEERIEASNRITDASPLSSVYQTENFQLATLTTSIDGNNEQTTTSASQNINSNDSRFKDQMMEMWSQESGTSYSDGVSIIANINVEINTVRTENETNIVDSSVANTQTALNSTIEKIGSTESLSPESETTLIDVSSNNEKADTNKANGILKNKSTTDTNGWTSSGNNESPTARRDEETTINYQTDDSIVTRKEEEAEANSNSQTETIFYGDNSNEQNVSVIIVEPNKILIEDDNLIISDINEQTDSIVEMTNDNESITKAAEIISSFSQTEEFDSLFKTEQSIDDQSKTTDFVNVITDNGNNGIDDNSTNINQSTIEREEIMTFSLENFTDNLTEITTTQTIFSQLPEIIIGTGDDIFENRNDKNIPELTTLENLQTTSFSMQTEKSNTSETKRLIKGEASSIQTKTDSTAFTTEIEEIEAFSSNSKNSTITEAELTTVKLSSKLESEFITLENIETTSSSLQTLSNRSEANEPIETSSTRTETILINNSAVMSININDRTNKASDNLEDDKKSTNSIDKTDKLTTLKEIEPDYSSTSGYDNTTEAKAQTVKLEIIISDTNGTKTDDFVIMVDSDNIPNVSGNMKINSNVKESNMPITDTQIYNTVISKAVTSAEPIVNLNPEPPVNEMPI